MTATLGLRDAKKEQTRREIATVALRLFLQRGFEEVSIAEIAEAAKVSKMTVFNYFPAKESMFFEFTHGRMPELGTVVRERRTGESPVDALHRFTRAELERRAEWTGLHDGIAEFSRLIFRSPTLVAGFNRIWALREVALMEALAEAVGAEHPPADLAGRLRAAWAGEGGDIELLAAITPDTVRLRIVAAQLLAAVQNLTMANQVRLVLGRTADEVAPDALRECDEAFELLRDGLGKYGA